MTITIDCRMIDASGIGVYLRGCLPYFLKSPHRFLLIGNKNHIAQLCGSDTARVDIAECDIKPFSLKELFFFPFPLLKKINRTNIYYCPYCNIPCGIKIPIYTTIHDIIFPDMPELTSRIGLIARMWFYKRAAKKSTKLFTVSQFSASRIRHHTKTHKEIIVTHSALQPYLTEAKPARDNVQTNTHKQNAILFVGNIKKHKGLSILLDAFFAARSNGLDHTLVIVGEKNNFRSTDTETLSKLASNDSSAVEFTGSLSDAELMTLYENAALLVQPSLYEGFGLPPLEAMTQGTQALISDIPVFKEVYANFPVVFFKSGDTEDLKYKLMNLLYNKKPVSIQLTGEQKNTYTFKKTAAVILAALTEGLL
jgi:glycosyltransferase involved in cell wall biosynthesis